MSGALLDELTRDSCGELARSGSVVLLPLGATEQHGPHLPLGTDTMHVEHVARAAAERANTPVVVAPTLPYGCSAHHLPFGGTASLSSEGFLRLLLELGGSFAASGFRRVFLLNGHGGNHGLMGVAARDLALAHPIDVAAGSWWHLATDRLVAAGALARGRLPGHAGAFESSLVLALRPDLVARPLPARDAVPVATAAAFADPLTIERHDLWRGIDGWSDSPAAADADDGASYLEHGVDAVVAAIEQFVAATERGGEDA